MKSKRAAEILTVKVHAEASGPLLSGYLEVFVKVAVLSERPRASSRLHHFLDETTQVPVLFPGQPVVAVVVQRGELPFQNSPVHLRAVPRD